MSANPFLRLFAAARHRELAVQNPDAKASDVKAGTKTSSRRAPQRREAPTPALPPKTGKRPGLQVLEGQVRTSYSKGTAESAKHNQRNVGGTAQWLERQLKARAKIELEVLNPEDWAKKHPMIPYGIPSMSPLGKTFLVVVPASSENLLTQAAMELQPHVSPQWRAKLKRAGVSYEQAAKSFAELAAKHELGHVYSQRIDLPADPAWFGEFLASYLAYADMRTREPAQAVIWDTLLDASFKRGKPDKTKLDDFATSLQEGLPAFLWHHGRYQARIREVFDSMGMDFIQRLSESLPAGESLTTRRLLTRLEAIAPGFVAWANA